MDSSLFQPIFDAKLEDTQEATLGDLDSGLIYYDIRHSILDKVSNLPEGERVDAVKRMVAEVVSKEINTTNAPNLVFFIEAFSEYEKPYFEKLDLSRSIANDTYSSETCRKCGKNKTFTTTVQIRGSDEPATKTVICKNKECGAHYTMAE